MNINENIRNKRKIVENKGCTCKFNYISASNSPIRPALVPIKCQYIACLLNDPICKLSENCNHEYKLNIRNEKKWRIINRMYMQNFSYISCYLS